MALNWSFIIHGVDLYVHFCGHCHIEWRQSICFSVKSGCPKLAHISKSKLWLWETIYHTFSIRRLEFLSVVLSETQHYDTMFWCHNTIYLHSNLHNKIMLYSKKKLIWERKWHDSWTLFQLAVASQWERWKVHLRAKLILEWVLKYFSNEIIWWTIQLISHLMTYN